MIIRIKIKIKNKTNFNLKMKNYNNRTIARIKKIQKMLILSNTLKIYKKERVIYQLKY